jgi:hypothetical protein
VRGARSGENKRLHGSAGAFGAVHDLSRCAAEHGEHARYDEDEDEDARSARRRRRRRASDSHGASGAVLIFGDVT